MNILNKITQDGIVIANGDVFNIVPFSFSIPENATSFHFDATTNKISYLVDDVVSEVELEQSEINSALEFIPEILVEVPQSLTRRQFHLIAFSLFGLTESVILSNINSISDETQRTLATIDYVEASVFRRNQDLLNSMAVSFGISQSELDTAFIQGAKIQ